MIEEANNIKWTNIKKDNNITNISIILYSMNNDQIYLLLGTESNNGTPNKTDIDLISNFRGQIMNDESIPQACGRILFEKTMNMVIEPFDFEKIVYEFNVKYIIKKNTIIFIHKIDYTEHQYIPKYYDRLYKYLMICTTSNSTNNWTIESCPVGYFDKSDLQWISINELINNPKIVEKLKKKLMSEIMMSFDIISESSTK